MQELYRIGRYSLKAGSQRLFRSGRHFLVLLITQGSCHISPGGPALLCLSPDMIFFKPGQTHKLFIPASCSVCELLSVSVPVKTLMDLSDETCDLCRYFQFAPQDTAVVRAEIEASLLITHIVTKLISLKDEELQIGIEMYEKSLFTSFLVLFLRACVQSDQVHRSHQKKELLIDNVFQYISHHLTEDLSLNALEKVFFVSGEHISREFKKSTGITLHSYITRARIDLSKKYILRGTPIREVYHLCGFGSYNNFFKAFKKECQMTPMGYYQIVSSEKKSFPVISPVRP